MTSDKDPKLPLKKNFKKSMVYQFHCPANRMLTNLLDSCSGEDIQTLSFKL